MGTERLASLAGFGYIGTMIVVVILILAIIR